MADRMTVDEAHTLGFDLVCRHTDRFAAYVRALPPEALQSPVPGSNWTAGEVIAHVQSVYERYTVDPTRAVDPAGVTAQNEVDVRRIGVDVEAAATSMVAQVERLAAAVPLVDPDTRFPFHAGLTVTMAGGWGNLLGELHAHGDDLSRATDQPFAIPSEDLEVSLRFATPLLAAWVAPGAEGLDESYDVEAPFGRVRFAITRGVLSTDADEPPRPDHQTIEVDDVAEWMLAFPYGRRPAPDAATARLASRFAPL